MLSFSRECTLQVYPVTALMNVADGEGALPSILPGGIIDATEGEDELPGQIDTTRANVERTAGPAGIAGAAGTAVEIGTDTAELDPTFQHSYSRDQSILIRRLRRIEGQVRGIERMIERREYCIDILQQTAALRAAVDSVALLILEDHVQGCVRTAAEQGDADRYIEEVLDVVRRTLGKPVRNPRV
jgi:CsoR family transcriptional regulator, copper-sensing transcriptional repressor